MYLLSSLAALLPLSICLLAPAARADDEETVSVFLPYYSEKWWSDMHGSIISKVWKSPRYTDVTARATGSTRLGWTGTHMFHG